jgi:hypothetical protein
LVKHEYIIGKQKIIFMKKLAILVGAIALTSSTFAQNDTWGSDK